MEEWPQDPVGWDRMCRYLRAVGREPEIPGILATAPAEFLNMPAFYNHLATAGCAPQLEDCGKN